jgi:hypothetical protein
MNKVKKEHHSLVEIFLRRPDDIHAKAFVTGVEEIIMPMPLN